MERTWKQSPSSQYTPYVHTQKNQRYQKLHGAIGAAAPSASPGSELLILLLLLPLLLLRVFPLEFCNGDWDRKHYNVAPTRSKSVTICPYIAFRHRTGTVYRHVRQMSDAHHRVMPPTLGAGHNNILRQHVCPGSAPYSAGPQ